MQDQIDFIREVCVKINPEIKDLKFGCVLKRKNNGGDAGYYQVLDSGSGFRPDHIWISSKVFGSMGARKNEIIHGTEEEMHQDLVRDHFEIIGQAIRLEDIVRVFTHISLPEVEIVPFGAPSLPGVAFCSRKKILFTWLMGKDLEDQSKENIDSIYKVFKK